MERLRRVAAGIAAAVGWVALDLQFAVLHANAAARGVGFATATVNFFSYFTILSNVLAAVVLTVHAAGSGGRFANFFRRPGTATAVALYMSVTGIVYVAILRHIWNPQGLEWVADTVLHYVMPVVYDAFWLFLVRKRGLTLRAVPVWILFPLAYGLYALVRGALTGFYPYPFVDAGKLGYPAVLTNVVLLAIGFAVLGALAVGISAMGRGRSG